MRRALFVSGCLCLSAWGALAVAQNSANGVAPEPWAKLLGTWKQLPGPDEPDNLKMELEGSNITVSFGCKQDSSCRSTITGNYDGKLHTYSDNASFEASFRKIGERTLQQDIYFNGKQDVTDEWQLSPDGNTLTATNRVVTSGQSRKVNYVYDRSGGPASKDNLFIGFWKHDWNKSDAVVLTYTSKAEGFIVTDPNGIAHVRNCDGNDHADNERAEIHYSCRFTDENTEETVFKLNGKVGSFLTTKVSADGKKLARIRKNAEGKTTSEVLFEKTN